MAGGQLGRPFAGVFAEASPYAPGIQSSIVMRSGSTRTSWESAGAAERTLTAEDSRKGPSLADVLELCEGLPLCMGARCGRWLLIDRAPAWLRILDERAAGVDVELHYELWSYLRVVRRVVEEPRAAREGTSGARVACSP
jgi:hypothetical protein